MDCARAANDPVTVSGILSFSWLPSAKGRAASWLARSGSVAPQQVLSSILIRSKFSAVGVKKPLAVLTTRLTLSGMGQGSEVFSTRVNRCGFLLMKKRWGRFLPRVEFFFNGKIKKIEMPEDLYVKVLQKASRFALPQCNQVSSYLNLSRFEHEYLYMSKNNDWTWKDIHFRRLSNNDWMRIQERVEQCLSSWKGKNLSNGGRLTLINSVLSSLPMYMMTFFEIPKGLRKKLDYFRSRFFWQTDEYKRKYRLAKWDILCQPKDQGGLGIHNLELKNIALLSKWLHRLLTIDGTRQQILRNKYLGTKPLVQV